VAKSRTSLGTGSLSGRFIESLFRLKNPNQSLPMAQQLRQLGDVGGDGPARPRSPGALTCAKPRALCAGIGSAAQSDDGKTWPRPPRGAFFMTAARKPAIL
jgi:hypothetical protein